MNKKFIPALMLAAVFSLFLFTCKDDSPDDKKESTDPVVESVTVSPATASVAHGGGETFTATVTGTNNPAQTVTWTVSGGVTGTAINENGELTVALGETATSLTVTATSTVNTTKSGTATVTVTPATATVTTVTVSPQNARVNKGGTRHFTASVTGTNNPAQTVTWNVTGGISGTSISNSGTTAGTLTIAANETAATLTVTATSTVDTSKSGNTTVTVGQVATPTDSRILNPSTQTTKLSNPSFALITKPHGGGNKWLIQADRLGYETWDEDTSGDANFRWFGQGQGGGAAFRAEWGNPNPPKDFLARVGYFWDSESPRKPHNEFGNIYCGFNFTTSGRYHGNFSYIGIYGWSRSPLVEYYIVENSYGNRWRDSAGYIQNFHETLQSASATADLVTTYTLDGASYKVYKKTRTGPSIAGNTTFTQYFSMRQTPRTSGTVSVTEHFKKWEEQGMNLGTMYECKFKVEVGGNPEGATILTGWFDASFIQFYRANDDGTLIHITQ